MRSSTRLVWGEVVEDIPEKAFRKIWARWQSRRDLVPVLGVVVHTVLAILIILGGHCPPHEK